MNRTIARVLATFCYIGKLPGPSGTWGSAAAIPLAYALHWLGGFPMLAISTVGLYGAGFWATRLETFEKDELDPREIVVDEVVGQWIALWPLSAGLWAASAAPHVFPWPGWVAGFVLFRLFDIVKIGPVGWADRRKGPTGVMLDDAIAGAMAAAVVTVMAAIAHGWLR
jgi:phosphatidylglycerophosphatase A